MSVIDVVNQFEKNIIQFNSENMQEVVARINDYIQKNGQSSYGNVSSLDANAVVNELDAIITCFHYEMGTPLQLLPIIAFDEKVDNTDNNVSVDVAVKYSKTLQEVFSFTFSEGLKISTTVSVKAKLPLIGESEVSVSGEASFGASQSWTTVESRTWEASNTIKIGAGESSEIKVVINNQVLNLPFTAKIIMGPQTAVSLTLLYANGGKASYKFPISALYTREQVADQLSIDVDGTYTGVEGVGVDTIITPI